MTDRIFPKKYKVPDSFKESADAMETDELKKRIIQLEQAISSTEHDMDADDKLNSLKEQVKERADIYKVSIKESQAMIKYSVWLLESRGQ